MVLITEGNKTTGPQSASLWANKLITHLADFFLTLGFGMSGVPGTALSPIHCSRGDSVPFCLTSCVRHKQDSEVHFHHRIQTCKFTG